METNPAPVTMQITLDLSRHCIETAAQKALDAFTLAFFKAGEETRAGLGARIEALGLFLETIDFPAARSQYPELAGGPGIRAVLDDRGLLLMDGGRPELPERAARP